MNRTLRRRRKSAVDMEEKKITGEREEGKQEREYETKMKQNRKLVGKI